MAAGRWTPLSDGVRLEIRLGTAPPLEVEALGLHSGDLLRLEATPRGGGPPTVHELTVEQLLARRQGKDVRLRLPTPAGEGPFEVRLVHLSAPARPAPG
ncbi:MAG: hypothetical protein HXY25_10075 [Alphaproteobacteria bacterium]|nr:hypothetical protein [Alphaproteobacteria bacterium]